eukprot:Hpha_TRINITY_DN15525_c5_g1::TRINITY_DN15525_c5_g1_i2::g.107387::m.107387
MPTSVYRAPSNPPCGPVEAGERNVTEKPLKTLPIRDATEAELGPFTGARLQPVHDWEPVNAEANWDLDFMLDRRVTSRLLEEARLAGVAGRSMAVMWNKGREPRTTPAHHATVMGAEVVYHMGVQGRRGSGLYIDFTFGTGGHSRAILNASASASVVGIDCDADARASAKGINTRFPGRFRFVHSRFSAARSAGVRVGSADGVLIDAGITDFQATSSERGFCLKPLLMEPPVRLDMRMDREGSITGADVLNFATREELLGILAIRPHDWQEDRAGAIADAFIRWREQVGPFETTHDLVRCVKSMPTGLGWDDRAAGILCRLLHMHVNGDLAELATGVETALDLLRPGGVLAVLTFKKLEWLAVRAALNASNQVQRIARVRPLASDLERVHTSRSATLWIVTKQLSTAQYAAVAGLLAVAGAMDFVRATVRLRGGGAVTERTGSLVVWRKGSIEDMEKEVQTSLRWCWPAGNDCGCTTYPWKSVADLPTDPESGRPVLVVAKTGRAAEAARAENQIHSGCPLSSLMPARITMERIRREFKRWIGPDAEVEPFCGGAIVAPCRTEDFFDEAGGFGQSVARSALTTEVEAYPHHSPPHIRVMFDGCELRLVPSQGWGDEAPQTPLGIRARRALQRPESAPPPTTRAQAGASSVGSVISEARRLLTVDKGWTEAPEPPAPRTQDRIWRQLRSLFYNSSELCDDADLLRVYPLPGGVLVGPVSASVLFGAYLNQLRKEFLVSDVTVVRTRRLHYISAKINDELVAIVPCASFRPEALGAEKIVPPPPPEPIQPHGTRGGTSADPAWAMHLVPCNMLPHSVHRWTPPTVASPQYPLHAWH